MITISGRERDDAFRAIGRYMVEFSQLVYEMRDLVCQHVAGGVMNIQSAEMLLGEATPQVIANAFFGMCSVVGELDDDEQNVARSGRSSGWRRADS